VRRSFGGATPQEGRVAAPSGGKSGGKGRRSLVAISFSFRRQECAHDGTGTRPNFAALPFSDGAQTNAEVMGKGFLGQAECLAQVL